MALTVQADAMCRWTLEQNVITLNDFIVHIYARLVT